MHCFFLTKELGWGALLKSNLALLQKLFSESLSPAIVGSDSVFIGGQAKKNFFYKEVKRFLI